MPVTIDIPSTLRASQTTALDVRPDANRVQYASDIKSLKAQTAIALGKIQGAINYLENLLRQSNTNSFENLFITGPGGAVIGWIGTYQGYQGAWFKQLYVGGTGPDDAPFFADLDGDVIIGKNGSLAIQDGGGNEVGWLGVQTDAPMTITNATNTNPIVMSVATHGYEDGDTVFISGVGGNTNANGYRIVKNPTAGTFEITDLAGVNVAGNGAYTAGGTAARYFGGGWFQTIAVGGTGFSDAKLRAYANGNVVIRDALIELIDGTGYIRLDPSGPIATFGDTFGGGAQVRIEAGYITVESLTPGAAYSEWQSGSIQMWPSGGLRTVLLTSDPAGLVSATNAAQTTTAFLSGATGLVGGDIISANNSLEVASTEIVDSGLNGKSFASMDSASYLVGGVPGASASFTAVTAVTPTTASAVDSVEACSASRPMIFTQHPAPSPANRRSSLRSAGSPRRDRRASW